MAFKLTAAVSTLEGDDSYTNDQGDHECVAFVQQASAAPNTSKWKKGAKVMDAAAGAIASGTLIATFDSNGKYPSTARHAAFYVSHSITGIVVYDQWNSKGKVSKRTIANKKLPQRSVNDAHYYFIVE